MLLIKLSYSLLYLFLVKAREIYFLYISHVENILQEGKMTEHILIRHLDGEGSLSSDTFN